MMMPKIDGRVQLTQDIPDLGLRRGDVGLVCSTWFSPTTAYEVEFESEKSTFAITGARLIDGNGSAPVPNVTVLVRDGRIAAVGARGSVNLPPGTPNG